MKKKRNLIFLSGFKNTGKDTVAELINKMSYGNYDTIGFADELKKQYYATVGYDYVRGEEDRDFKEGHREGLIRFGEAKKQEAGMHHWIEAALDPYLFDKDSKRDIIVTDCRRTEEMLWYSDFINNKLIKYSFIRENFQPHFFAVHRKNSEYEDTDYLTHVAVRVSTELMFLPNRLIRNYSDLDGLKKTVEEIYAIRLK